MKKYTRQVSSNKNYCFSGILRDLYYFCINLLLNIIDLFFSFFFSFNAWT